MWTCWKGESRQLEGILTLGVTFRAGGRERLRRYVSRRRKVREARKQEAAGPVPEAEGHRRVGRAVERAVGATQKILSGRGTRCDLF